MTLRLPQNYVPIHYDLYIRYFKNKFPFPASVTITFKKNQDSDKTYLRVLNNIIINKVIQNNIKLEFNWEFPQLIIYRSKDPDQDISSYPITIDYEVLPDLIGGKGFYAYKDSFLTSFEPDLTPYLLPCFDDPSVRSSFTVKIRIPANLTGISNMPIENCTTFGEEKEITFQPTPPMCCYLLSIFVGPFNSIADVTKNGTPVIFYSDHLDQLILLYYLNIAIFSLEWFESKMGVKYELPFLQFLTYEGITLGMENYGLIALCDVTKSDTIQNALTIMHEIAHLWFGDLVSIKWWDSIWLNEGFAQYFEFLVLKDCLEQKHDIAVQIFIKYCGTQCLQYFDNDKLVCDESEIDFSKDVLRIIFYVKGSFVLKMFSDIIGEENFNKICSNYLTIYKNQTVEVSDFLTVANKTMNKDFSNFFDIWLKKVGFPLLKVTELKNEKDEFVGIKITQQSVSKSIFQFKLQILYGKNDQTEKLEIMVNEGEIVVDVKFDWIIVNNDFQSLCIVIYSKVLLEKLVGIRDQINEANSELIYLSSIVVKDVFDVDEEILSLCQNFKKKEKEEEEVYFLSSSSSCGVIYADGTSDDYENFDDDDEGNNNNDDNDDDVNDDEDANNDDIYNEDANNDDIYNEDANNEDGDNNDVNNEDGDNDEDVNNE